MKLFGDVNNPIKLGTKAYRAHLDGNKLFDIGKVEEAKKKHAEALKMYDEAYELGLNRVNILLGYGIMLMRVGQFEKAKEVFLKIHYTPNLPKEDRFYLRINYAVCLWKMGQIDEAVATIKRAADGTRTTGIYTTMGMLLILQAEKTGDFTEAIAFNAEAYDYDEDDAAILDNIGLLHYKLHQFAAKKGDEELAKTERKLAYDFFTAAHKRRPGQTSTLYYLAKLFFEDGQVEQARQCIDQMLKGNFTAISTVTLEEAQALKAKIG